MLVLVPFEMCHSWLGIEGRRKGVCVSCRSRNSGLCDIQMCSLLQGLAALHWLKHQPCQCMSFKWKYVNKFERKYAWYLWLIFFSDNIFSTKCGCVWWPLKQQFLCIILKVNISLHHQIKKDSILFSVDATFQSFQSYMYFSVHLEMVWNSDLTCLFAWHTCSTVFIDMKSL